MQLADAATAQLAVIGELLPQVELGCIFWKTRDRNAFHRALREGFAEATQIGFQSPDHHRLEISRTDFYAAGKALGVEHFEQSREAVGMSVARSSGEEQSMLEAMSQIVHCSGQLARNRIARATGRSRVVRFVKDRAPSIKQPRVDISLLRDPELLETARDASKATAEVACGCELCFDRLPRAVGSG
jgi:hypothetical protein